MSNSSSSTIVLERTRPVVMGHRGMIASAHGLASMAGIDVLRNGGNAVDAAIAVNAALNVTQPGACGIGGDLFALVYMARERKVRFLNGSGRSPAKASIEQLREEGHAHMPQRGIRSVTVPGCVDAWFTLHEAYGTRPMDELLKAAIELAREGFPISHNMASSISDTAASLNPHSSWLETFCPGGRPPRPGERFRQPDLASSLEEIARHGRDAFYRGRIAEAIVALSRELGGWFEADDLASHRSDWGEPIATEYRGYTIFETPPNTQGLAVLVGLNIMDGWPQGEWDWDDPARHHHTIEAKRLAYAERDAHVADPAFYRAPLERLLSKEYAAALREKIRPDQAAPFGPARGHGGGTTYFAVADAEGNLVSCVQSLYKGFGALVVPRGTGISLHNRGGYFSLDPEHPNALAPRKRPFHTLIASMAFKGVEPVLVFGTMGGDGQPQTHMQVFANIFEYGMDIQQAIEAPRWAHDVTNPLAPSNELLLEARFGEAFRGALERLGHRPRLAARWDSRMGHAQGILVGSGTYMGGADPRGDGYALGW